MRREFRSMVPVELSPGVPATLVIGYRTALQILNDPAHFPADPRVWQRNIPASCPIRPMLEWRPVASRSTGSDFLRYRRATASSINAVDLFALHDTVESIAVPMINSFCQDGSADLIRQYVFPLVFQVVNALLGCSPEIGQRLATATAAIVEAVDAEEGNKLLSAALLELVTLKKAEPQDDITSHLLQDPADLTTEEAIHHVAQIYGTGIEFLLNLIVNTLLLIVTDERFGGRVLGGVLTARDALDEVLFNDPPLANLLISFPPHPILIDEVWLPAHQPVVISMAACNNDPAIRTDDMAGNCSHLAWGVGQHACPAQSLAYLVAQDAIDQLLDAIPEIRLNHKADVPTWRPGPFHRALTALPVQFQPTSPLGTG
ncbi:cytochrome P450 monooxygenase [Nocardia brasiliensis ATCC 700358]|uniref:Cytochrome P450 monooxygenase n=3 Tax=Nocardia brasiliensis TaxID=37326 RepID=K0F562_NOCB7|nr:cytochrome P450 monooxygenase [Nocardia brasiliensis ATCC 700358]